jgi:LmbE family N-acetylglucosaminyl deacetylase
MIRKKVLVIVAHPDDEIIWMGLVGSFVTDSTTVIENLPISITKIHH